MAIPDYQAVMLPLLQALSDGHEYKIAEVTKTIADLFALSEDEREELLPSGQSTVINNRVGWAKTYLKKAGLIDQPKRGIVRISDLGQKLLQEKPDSIDSRFLERYPSYVEFAKKSNEPDGKAEKPSVETGQTPEELLEASFDTLHAALADELLDQLKACSPTFFERLVVDLLVAMGYGGSVEDAGKAVGKSGDGGIDGVIKEDKLGLDVVVIQAKRWDTNTVGRPEVQGFAGSMEPHRAKKGVFITTSTFSEPAREYVKQAERKIVLIDGKRLADLMIEHGVGVTTYRSYTLKRLDSDYFEEQ